MPLPQEVLPRDPGDHVSAVTDLTPHSADADFEVTNGVYIGANGNLQVIMADGSDVTFVGVVAGSRLRIRIIGTRSAGTTMTNLMRLY